MKHFSILGAVLIASVFLAGCGGGQVDANRPIEQIVAEAQKMSVNDLKAIIQSYQDVISNKKLDIDKVKEKLKQIPISQMLGEDAKKLKDEVFQVTTAISALTERMNVYIQELTAKGGTL